MCKQLDTPKIKNEESRNFNILSNQYINDHDNKAKQDQEYFKKISEQKYAKDKYYDPIKNEFFRENDEKI